MDAALSSGSMEARFLDHLPVLKEVIRIVCRRHQLADDEAADFAGSVYLKIVEKDYAVLRRLRIGGNLRSFLFTVVQRHLLDRRNHEWGKWRASVRARELGSAAVFLERLVTRDRLHVHEAASMLANHPRWALSSHDVRDLQAQLQFRQPRACPVDGDEIEERYPARPATSPIEVDEWREQAKRARRALAEAIRSLPPEERTLLRMRFQEGRQISEIAAKDGVDAKPLYRRFQRLLGRLRLELEQRNVSHETVRALVGQDGVEFGSTNNLSDL